MQTFHVLPKLLAAAVLALAAGNCTAAVITTAVGDGADTYIRLGQGSTNFGTAGDVVIKDNGGSSTTRKGYLRFDLSAETGAFLDAELLFDVILNNSAGGAPPPNEYTVRVYGLNDGHAGENWNESTISWNDAPANVIGNNLVGEGATFLGRFTVPAQEPTYQVSFDNPLLRNFLNQDTDGLATFILTRQGGGGGNNLAFASKEHGSGAEPALSGTTVPAQVLSISTNDGAGADSYIQSGTAASFGDQSGIVLKHTGATTTRKGYLRFDLAGASADILDAALTLQVATNNAGRGDTTTPQNFSVDVFGLVDGHAGELWDELGINWNDAPANAGGNSLTGDAIPLGSFEVLDDPEGSRVMFTSPELIDFLSDDTNDLATLILTRGSGSGSHNLAFASGEHSTFLAPTLTITGVPEPSTGLLMAFALLGLALGRYGRRTRRTAAVA